MEIVSSTPHLSLTVTHLSEVGEVRRAAKLLVGKLDFTEEQTEKVAIVATESATNLAAHAREGEMLLCPFAKTPGMDAHIDLIAVDRGPGILDLPRSMDDGFSSAGTAGNGLGAISRLSDHFDIYSDRSTGTVLLSRIFAKQEKKHQHSWKPLSAAYVSIPKRGEHLCGDTVALRLNERGGAFIVADGLGHGISANEASIGAARIFSETPDSSPANLMEDVHRGLRATRGAAVAIANIDCESRTLQYSGVGNIAAAIIQGASSRSLISHNGIVGHQTHKIQEFNYPWPESGILIMNSDGLQTNWRLTPYPGLTKKDPAIIAAVLYRDFNRGRDDVAVLVVKQGADA